MTASDPTSLAEAALQKVRVQVSQRRLRLDDFFTDFDNLRSGCITAAQFRRALTVSQVHLRDDEFDALSAHFSAPPRAGRSPPGGAVSYASFLRALRSEDPPAEMLTTTARRARQLSPEEERGVAAAMESLRRAARAHGLHLRRAFEDFDPFHTGKVTASRFHRCLPFESVPEEAVRLMVKKYSDEDGEVLYAAWCRDLEGDGAGAESTARSNMTGKCGSAQVSPRGQPLSADALLQILREQFAMYRLRCDDFLRDFDGLRTGFVSGPQFASALGRLRLVDFHLTADHIDTLTRAYAREAYEQQTGDNSLGGPSTNAETFLKVNYVQFLADTDPRGEENSAAIYYESTRSAGQFLGPIGDSERERADALIAKIGRLVSSNRIHLVPTLHDFDHARKGIYEHRTCTISRFERSLATNKIFLPAEELALLVKRYVIRSADGSPSDQVNYYQFVMDVDQTERPQQMYSARQIGTMSTVSSGGAAALGEMRRRGESDRIGPAASVDDVLARIVEQAEERGLRVNEFFADFDPLRSGLVQTEKFVIALGIAGLQLYAEEMDLLLAAYCSTRAKDRIDTGRFIADIGFISPTVVPSVTTRFTLTKVSPQTTMEASDITPANQVSLSGKALAQSTAAANARLTEEERTQLPKLLQRLAHDVASHHALLAPFFSDFDRFHRGKIPRSSFVQALARHRFLLTAAETALLLRFYAAAKEPDMIEYNRFIADVGQDESAITPSAAAATRSSLSDTKSSGFLDKGVTVAVPATRLPGDGVDEDLAARVLRRICCFLQERGARLSEFFPDGDELRHRHVTNTRFRHCLSMLGLDLSEAELSALEAAFAHCELRGHVDYMAFFAVVQDKLQAGEGLMAVTQRRRGTDSDPATAAAMATAAITEETNGNNNNGDEVVDLEKSTQARLYASAVDKVRRTLAARRAVSLEAFRQYDRPRKGFVKEGQFFATLMSLGVQLTPSESDALRKAHSASGGEMKYTKFSLITDDPRFT